MIQSPLGSSIDGIRAENEKTFHQQSRQLASWKITDQVPHCSNMFVLTYVFLMFHHVQKYWSEDELTCLSPAHPRASGTSAAPSILRKAPPPLTYSTAFKEPHSWPHVLVLTGFGKHIWRVATIHATCEGLEEGLCNMKGLLRKYTDRFFHMKTV